MRWKIILGFIFLLAVLGLLVIYWFVPLNSSEFFVKNTGTNFSLGNSSDMQFYPNMRFPEANISYRIEDCPLQKQGDMERAFEILEEMTVLSFYPVPSGEEISVTCSSENRMEEGLFIAGEGGPTNITKGNEFNIIFNGMVLLIRDSPCSTPNVAIHELLHVLGFDHSENPNNIMYPVSKCDQEIGEDTIGLINELYSLPSYADLSLENVSAIMNGKYLEASFTVRNYGFKNADSSQVKIYADNKEVKTVNIEPIAIGYGMSISLENIFIAQLGVDNLKFEIEADFPELDKENNEVTLEIQE